MRRYLGMLSGLVLSAALLPGGAAAADGARAMVAAAHPLAAAAGLDALRRGGSVVDAAVAVQMVLTVVEPQASGIGGGALMLMWERETGKMLALDGLSAAPARTTASLRTDLDGKLLPAQQVVRGGRSVAVPGAVRVLAMAHKRSGRLPWAGLFDAGIAAAENGFPMPPYLQSTLRQARQMAEDPEIRQVFFGADGAPLPVGATVRNPRLADALRQLAADPEALNRGALAGDILASLARGRHPSLIDARDLADYKPVERTAICHPFLSWRVCTFPPPSFGGLTMLQQLATLAAAGIDRTGPGSADAGHLLIESARLAAADRRAYVGDPDQVTVPVAALLAGDYLAGRARLVGATAIGQATPGSLAGVAAASPVEEPGTSQTSHVAIVDAAGNALSMTTTLNLNFGSGLMPHGFFLNNAMTNFAGAPPRGGVASPNAMAPRKRPVTAMAPSLAFDGDGRLALVAGAGGGGFIPDYVTQAVVGTLAWGLEPRVALDLPHVAGNTGRSQAEKGKLPAAVTEELVRRGHKLEEAEMRSGAAALRVTPQGIVGAADRRRDGTAVGY